MATRLRAASSLAAFVLHRYDWSESSLILDLLTRDLGRIAVVAKGAKRPYSQMRSVLLPFQRINVSLGRSAGAEGSPEIHSLRAAEWSGGGPMLAGAALFSGFYMNELLMKLLARHDAHPALFDVYAETLTLLSGRDERRTEAALRGFELTLLREMGVLPELSVATTTQEPVASVARYTLSGEAGVAEAPPGEGGVAGQALVALQAALEHGNLAALHAACEAVLPELKSVLRTQLHYHLGSMVLRTRQVMVQAQNLEREG